MRIRALRQHAASVAGIVAALSGLSITFAAHAELLLPQEGTWRTTLQARDLNNDGKTDAYYDTDLNITWQANPNLSASETFGVKYDMRFGSMTWSNSQAWIKGMNDANYLGYSDWRLPQMLCSSEGACPNSYWVTPDSSEFSHLMAVTLGQSGLWGEGAPFVSDTGKGYGMIAPFYWTGMPRAGSGPWVFEFRFGGDQHIGGMTDENYVWAVRDGDVASVPEISTLAQMGAGLLALAGLASRQRRR